MSEWQKSESPMFVGGLFKSGTTLLRAMLQEHPDIASGLETYWFDLNWEDKRGNTKDEYEQRKWDASRDQPLGEHIERLVRFFEMDESRVGDMVKWSQSPEEFLDRFMSHHADNVGKDRWLEKTPANIVHAERIYDYWSSPRLMHIIRHPMDVFASIKQAGKEGLIDNYPKLWCKFVGEGVRKASDGSMDILEIKYENLVYDTEGALQKCLDYSDVEWESDVREFDGKQEDYEKVKDITGVESGTLARTAQPITDERIGIAEEVVTEQEADRIETGIRELGYGDEFDSLTRDAESIVKSAA